MPLTEKGQKIMKSMKDKYGPEKGKEVFYASKNKGKIKSVDKGSDKMDKVTCPKCKGKGCSHCGGKGYHMKKGYAAGGLKSVPEENKGLGKLPQNVRNKMGYMYGGGMAKKRMGYAHGGMAKCGASNPGTQKRGKK